MQSHPLCDSRKGLLAFPPCFGKPGVSQGAGRYCPSAGRTLTESKRMSAARLILSLVILIGATLVGSCGPARCEGGVCACNNGASCDFVCDAPPCKVECEGNNKQCNGECANSDCSCGPGSTCEISCHSEPCHLECVDSSCAGECGNGTCTCEEGSTCDFECKSGPCHVQCKGNHTQCDGECANGSCTCGPDSTCDFECTDANCSFVCEAGSSCLATCPGGTLGSQGCAFSECAAGDAVVCPDGVTLACGAECPKAS